MREHRSVACYGPANESPAQLATRTPTIGPRPDSVKRRDRACGLPRFRDRLPRAGDDDARHSSDGHPPHILARWDLFGVEPPYVHRVGVIALEQPSGRHTPARGHYRYEAQSAKAHLMGASARRRPRPRSSAGGRRRSGRVIVTTLPIRLTRCDSAQLMRLGPAYERDAAAMTRVRHNPRVPSTDRFPHARRRRRVPGASAAPRRRRRTGRPARAPGWLPGSGAPGHQARGQAVSGQEPTPGGSPAPVPSAPGASPARQPAVAHPSPRRILAISSLPRRRPPPPIAGPGRRPRRPARAGSRRDRRAPRRLDRPPDRLPLAACQGPPDAAVRADAVGLPHGERRAFPRRHRPRHVLRRPGHGRARRRGAGRRPPLRPVMGWVGDLGPYLRRLEQKNLWSTLPIVVVTDDGNGYRSMYAHFGRIVVKKGQTREGRPAAGLRGSHGTRVRLPRALRAVLAAGRRPRSRSGRTWSSG